MTHKNTHLNYERNNVMQSSKLAKCGAAFEITCNTESYNAWRFHELIVGFFSRRELGPPVPTWEYRNSSVWTMLKIKVLCEQTHELLEDLQVFLDYV